MTHKIILVILKRILWPSTLIVIACNFMSIRCSGQGLADLKRTDLIPASPTAAALGKSGEVPVNLSSGSMSLSIPVFTIKSRYLELPIGLNYTYNGYNPQFSASWIGLGWTLNAGGVISRKINGRLDNTASNGSNYENDYVRTQVNSAEKDIAFLDGVNKGYYDSEPDLYTFNFGVYSGKFLKFKGKFYCFPFQKFKILGDDTGFTITTDDGTKYYFGETETSSPKGNSNSPYNIPTHVSSWYLSKITSCSGNDNIYFEYADEGLISRSGTLTQTYKKYLYSTQPQNNLQSELLPLTTVFPTYVRSKRLTNIISEKFRVNFTQGVRRTDIYQEQDANVRSLGGITVSNNSGNVIKSYSLKQSFSGNTLVLDSILENPVNNETDEPSLLNNKYKFGYVAIDNVNKLYAKVDHYGFYKGGEFNRNVILPNSVTIDGTTNNYYSGGEDREPNLNSIQGALAKVTYPTGSTNTFTYELNTAFTNNTTSSDLRQIELQIVRPANNPVNIINSEQRDFTIDRSQTVYVNVSRIAKRENADGFARNSYMDFSINKINGSAANLVASGSIAQESENSGKLFSYRLEPGNYRFQIFCDEKENKIQSALDYAQDSGKPNAGQIVGGIRIKRIVSDSKTGNYPIVKEFAYTDESGFPSGYNNFSGYDQKQYIERRGSGLNYWDNYYSIFTSIISENYRMGVPHFYKSVLVTTSSGLVKHCTRTNFKSFTDYMMGVEPMKIIDYKSNNNNTLTPLKSLEYEYEVKVDTFFRGVKAVQTMEATAGPNPLYDYDIVRYEYLSAWKYLKSTKETSYINGSIVETSRNYKYDLFGSRNLLADEVKTSKGKIQLTTYKYPESYAQNLVSPLLNANLLNLVLEKQNWLKNSSSDSTLQSTIITQYDYSNYKPIKIYSVDLINLKSLNNEQKNAQGLYTQILSDTRASEKISFEYDSYGNVINQKAVNGTTLSYKYGRPAINYYAGAQNVNNTSIILEAKNGGFSEIFYQNFEDVSGTTTDDAHTGSNSISSYTVIWNRPNSKKYEISYWYRSNSKWYLKQDIYNQNSYVLTGGDRYDDVIVKPTDCLVSTFVTKEGIGTLSITDPNGDTKYFEYDEFLRLKTEKDQSKNILKHNVYYLAQDKLGNSPGALYRNQAKSQVFIKNDCPPGYTGSSITYTVSANTYSGLSQADADAKAQADINANGQLRANQGTCTYQSGGVE